MGTETPGGEVIRYQPHSLGMWPTLGKEEEWLTPDGWQTW